MNCPDDHLGMDGGALPVHLLRTLDNVDFAGQGSPLQPGDQPTSGLHGQVAPVAKVLVGLGAPGAGGPLVHQVQRPDVRSGMVTITF